MFQTRLAPTRLVPFLSIAACLALFGSSSAAGTFTGTVLPPGGSPAVGAASQGTPADDRLGLAATTGCQPSWLPVDGAPSLNGFVYALQVLDFGSGPELYVAGAFTSAGGVPANGIAKWDGSSWSGISSVISNVRALAVFDDGSGPALYVGGTTGIAKWNGVSWSAFGMGLGGTHTVNALAVYDDGAGPALYVGGDFSSAGTVVTNGIAKWNGTSWSDVGGGLLGGRVFALLTTPGSQPDLYVGGVFQSVGGVAANCIAKWDGTSWSPLGAGVDGGFLGPSVNALVRFQDSDDAHPALYVGGSFNVAGSISTQGIAKWNGTQWSNLGAGVDGDYPVVYALAGFDDGSGSALYAGGWFSLTGVLQAKYIAKWDGTAWRALGAPSQLDGGVGSLAVFDGGDGPALYVGGSFTSTPAGDSYLAKWGCPVPPITALPGCAGNPATLEALASGAPLGAPLPLRITGSAAASGLGQAFFGASGLDAGGCGLLAPGIGELLLALAPAPSLVASGSLAGGVCDVAPLVPTTPALSGVTAYLQGLALDLALASPIEPTNALAVKLGP